MARPMLTLAQSGCPPTLLRPAPQVLVEIAKGAASQEMQLFVSSVHDNLRDAEEYVERWAAGQEHQQQGRQQQQE